MKGKKRSFSSYMIFFIVSSLLMSNTAFAYEDQVSTVLDRIAPHNQPVYYVHLFNGDFPIPTRFEVYLPGHGDSERIRLESPSMPLMASRDMKMLGLKNTGAIEIGVDKNYISTFWGSNSNAADIQRFTCYGLYVEVNQPANTKLKDERGKTVRVRDVLIYRGAQFVSITGVDHSLWKQLIRVYGALSGKIGGPNCPVDISE